MNDQKYFSRSWALITRDKGWIKPILVMAAALLVPVAGAFGVNGYVLEYARLTAWGVDAAPKQKDVEVGKCIKSGACAFVVSLGWGFAWGFATRIVLIILGLLPGNFGAIVVSFASFAISVASAFVYLGIELATLRATLYEKIVAGYRINRIIEMIRRDLPGFCRVFLINVVCTIAIGLAMGLLIACLMPFLLPIILAAIQGYVDAYLIADLFAHSIVPVVLVSVLFGYLISIVSCASNLIVTNALALWMRQFDVPSWGREEDPLP